MPQCDIAITITVRALRGQNADAKEANITYTIPKNGTPGCPIVDAGKLKIGAAAEELATLLDTDRTPL